MVRWKPTFAALCAAILLIQFASGCALSRKGRWRDPQMVAPCPEANPKSQYPFGIWWHPCDVTAIDSPDLSSPELVELAPKVANQFVQLCAFEEDIEAPEAYEEVSTNLGEAVVGRPLHRSSNMPNLLNHGGERIETPRARAIAPEGIGTKIINEPMNLGPEFFQSELGEGEVLYMPELQGIQGMPGFVEQAIPETESADIQLRQAESYYAMAVDADKQLDESAMNMYLDAAIAAYRYMQTVPPQPKTTKGTERAWQVYHSSIARLMFIADKSGYIDKQCGIKLPVNGGYKIVQFEYVNFQRTADDFDRWHIVGDYQSKFLLTKHRSPGLGVPMVCIRERKPADKWYPEEVPFAVTGILRPEAEMNLYDATVEAAIPSGTHVEQVVAKLELYDPRTSGDVEFNCRQVPLAKDTTAPYAYLLSETRGDSKLKAMHPYKDMTNQGLFILEPHRKGKIPVIFVHGLLSAPYTWAGIANEIDSNPDLAARYEAWAFHYPTGAPFMESAAVLRDQLNQIITEMDPSGFDRDLRNIVLVGHSMGGLIAKLQVTDSGNTLWEHVAFQPLSSLDAPPQMQHYLRDQFYFTHSPNVGRVIFIGTPHQGTTHLSAKTGHVSSTFVHEDPCLKDAHKQLIEDNPAAFRKEFRHRVPISLDLISPKSLLLTGIYRLPIQPDIPTHTILGSGWWSPHDGQSDSVVPVSSARLPGVQTEIMVNSLHTHLNRNAGTVCEVLRILRVHGTRPAFASQNGTIR
ncbi:MULTISPECIES: esterase/lipase family protein [Pirellulaceae]|uniref:esterase/lipase family protein n=1 Tax=Pirellulaceae TaxID=2691357 RepID=UPI001304D051|nr:MULTISPECIES: alpha/beta fold hydrolase [Pirellulaceae]